MLSFGKALRLQRCATPSGHIVMVALDHRGLLWGARTTRSLSAIGKLSTSSSS
jgi:hypothetical protein